MYPIVSYHLILGKSKKANFYILGSISLVEIILSKLFFDELDHELRHL